MSATSKGICSFGCQGMYSFGFSSSVRTHLYRQARQALGLTCPQIRTLSPAMPAQTNQLPRCISYQPVHTYVQALMVTPLQQPTCIFWVYSLKLLTSAGRMYWDDLRRTGTQFTCFNGTKLHILTLTALQDVLVCSRNSLSGLPSSCVGNSCLHALLAAYMLYYMLY